MCMCLKDEKRFISSVIITKKGWNGIRAFFLKKNTKIAIMQLEK